MKYLLPLLLLTGCQSLEYTALAYSGFSDNSETTVGARGEAWTEHNVGAGLDMAFVEPRSLRLTSLVMARYERYYAGVGPSLIVTPQEERIGVDARIGVRWKYLFIEFGVTYYGYSSDRHRHHSRAGITGKNPNHPCHTGDVGERHGDNCDPHRPEPPVSLTPRGHLQGREETSVWVLSGLMWEF